MAILVTSTKPTRRFSLKLPLLGEPAVGKTTLVKAFMEGIITERYAPTLGIEIGKKTLMITRTTSNNVLDRVEPHFQLWDIAGQTFFKKIRSSYYRGASGLILVYDIGRHSTFEALEKWLEEAWTTVGQVPMVLVGNKLDLRQKGNGEVSKQEGMTYARQIEEQLAIPTPFVEASALRTQNADKPFKELAKLILTRQEEQAD